MRVEVWSDVVCRWCYIGKRRLERALEHFAQRDEVEVVWRSLQLDPTAPEDETCASLRALGRKYGASLDEMRAMQARVEEVAAGEGLHFRLAESTSGNTTRAHELLHLAQEHDLGPATKERLLHAHFEENRSVFDVDGLARRYADAVRDDAAEAHALGATGVPFFVVDRRYGAAGAQPAEVLLQLLERAWAEHAAAV